jgi:hypothetical protein
MTTIYNADWGNSGRRCGGCTLCCKLLPVAEIDKPAGQRCKHQSHAKGCAVYQKSAFPYSCAMWNCRWLANLDTADLRRPDRSHYVLDVMPDYVTLRNNQTGEDTKVEIVQVWVDPDFPDAHRDPALRAYLARRGEEGVAALIRYDSSRGFALFPPAMSSDGQWHEQGGESSRVGRETRKDTMRDMIKGVAEARGLK